MNIQRYFRMSLRSIFVVVLVSGTLFAFVSIWHQRAMQQKAAIHWLQNNSNSPFVSVFYDHQVFWIDKGRLEVAIASKGLCPPPDQGFKGLVSRILGVDYVCNVALVRFVFDPPEDALTHVKNLYDVNNLRQIELPGVYDAELRLKWEQQFSETVVIFKGMQN